MKQGHALASMAIIAGMAVASLGHAQEISVTPQQLKWAKSPASPSDTALLMGDPRKDGPFVVRARLKPGMKVMPHSHPIDVQITVLSGTLLFGQGETFDEKKMKEYPTGSFFVERANSSHYQMPKGNAEMIFQASGTGINAFKYVNPKDDPRTK